MALLRSLTVQMGLDAAKYRSDLDLTTKKTETSFDKMDKASKKMQKGVSDTERSVRQNVSNLSYQMQDVAVQWQMGIDGAIIAAQQLPQALVGFGMVGALAGAAIAVAGLAVKLDETADSSSTLKDTMDALSKIVVENDDGVNMLSSSYARLAKEQSEMAKAQLALSMTQATQAINAAKKSADDAVMSLDKMFGGFSVTATEDAIKNLDATLERTGLTTSQLLNETDLYATGLGQLSSMAQHLSDELGTTTDQSVEMVRAFAEFKESDSPKAINELAKSVTDLSLNTKNASPEFQQLAVDLNELSLESASAQRVLELLKKAFEGSDVPVENLTDAYDDLRKSLEFDISLIGKSALEQQKMIAVQQLGKSATLEQVEAIEALIEKKYELENAPSWGDMFGSVSTVDISALKKYTDGQKQYLQLSNQLSSSNETLEERYARESKLLEENYTDYEHYITMKQLLDENYSKSLAANEMKVQSILMESQARNLSTLQQGFAGLAQYAQEGSTLAKLAFVASQGVAAAQVMVSAEQAKWQAASTIPNAAAQAAVMSSIDAQKYVSLALIGAQTGAGLAGMAHDGIDNVPREGTWLLDKGERVVDSRTNADLKNFLASGGGKGGNVTVQVMGNIYGDDETRRIISTAAQQGYSMVANDAKSNGVIYKQMRR